MAGNSALSAAKRAKQDEFYTQLSDIEKELKHYRKHFKDRVVLCNCDDPFESNFFKYFVLNFNKLGLKKLIATSYVGSPIAGSQLQYHADKDGQMTFSFKSDDLTSDERPYKAVVTNVYDKTGNDAIEMLDIAELFGSGENELVELKGDGDFRSDECIELLKEADIVVTNPPFSLFREYVANLMEYDKKFIIIGNFNAIKYKEIFPLFKKNEIWLGYGFSNGNAYFSVSPENGAHYAKGVYDSKTGLVKFRNCCWFTNLDIKKRHEELILVKKYDSNAYQKYDNYDAIEVPKVADIPYDYDGVMGVPITFMDKYDPDQFEILEGSNRYGILDTFGMNDKIRENHSHGNNINGKAVYFRILIRNKHPEQPEEI